VISLEDKIIKEVDENIKTIIDNGITTDNLDLLYKLTKIKHITKEDKEMYGNYGNYNNYSGRGAGYNAYGRGSYGDSYGNYGDGSYGRRGYDMKYRGDEELDRMHGEYGRYQESRNRYGAGEETDKSFHYMVKALEDFIKVLYEEAETQQQKQMLRESLQKSMM
jgi:hypothetical protein